MRAIAFLFFGLAFLAVFAGSGYTTASGTMGFGAPSMTYLIIALVMVGAGFVFAFLAQKPPGK